MNRLGPLPVRILLAPVVLAVGVATAARALGWEPGVLATAVALTPWFAILSLLATIAAVLARAPVLLAASVACALVQLAWLVPLYRPAPAPEQPSRQLVVMAANLLAGQGSEADVVAIARSQRVDILAIEELKPAAVERLRDEGLDELMPHKADYSMPSVIGSGLWSKYPIARARLLPGHAMNNIAADVNVGGEKMTVVVAHPAAPGLLGHDSTDSEMAVLRDQLAAISGPVVAAGDFNSTRDQVGFRRIEESGFEEAATQAGRGLIFTWPSGGWWLPGLGRVAWIPEVAAIDHVLSRDTGLVATNWSAWPVSGSDHRAVVAVLSG